jgi:hypothetical protein
MFDHNVPVFKCPEVQYINRFIIEIYKINLIYELKTVACIAFYQSPMHVF